jgi:hypothetical protein
MRASRKAEGTFFRSAADGNVITYLANVAPPCRGKSNLYSLYMQRKRSAFFAIALFLFVVAHSALASNGMIDPVSHYSWNDDGGLVSWDAFPYRKAKDPM